MRQFKVIVEKHSHGYVVYPLGLKDSWVLNLFENASTLLWFVPNHPRIKASTLRTICRQAREEFLKAYEQA